MIDIKEVDFETVKHVWVSRLWPGRYDVKPMSSMVYGDFEKFDMNVYMKYTPTFWAAYSGDKVVGVNSGFRTSDTQYRSRGIWVDPEYRKCGIAQQLFLCLEKQAHKEGCKTMWSFPRKGSHHAYLKYGFTKTSDWIHDAEYGINCYVLKDVALPK